MAGASQRSRRAVTLLAQMADMERGQRIKDRRNELHLTQPAVADTVGVTLRAFQEWEAGGGIRWEHCQHLAGALAVDPEWIMRGDPPPTPDLSRDARQLDRIEAKIDTVLRLLEDDGDDPPDAFGRGPQVFRR